MHDLPVNVIYKDYAEGSDTVLNEQLLKQVEKYGRRQRRRRKESALAWIKTFLNGRRQQVRVNDAVPSWRTVDNDVFKG